MFYHAEAWRGGVQYVLQRWDVGPGHRQALVSAFVVVRVTRSVRAIARVDKMHDPNPRGERIPYLPLDPESRATLWILGVDLKVAQGIHFLPNVELVTYSPDGEGRRPAADLFLRWTFWYRF